MNKKLISIALSGALFICGLANADCDPTVYVGGEIQANKYTGTKKIITKDGTTVWRLDNKPLFGKSGLGASIFVGSRIHDYVGVELGASANEKTKFGFRNDPNIRRTFPDFSSSSLKSSTNNVYGDLLGYLPVSNQFDLIAAVGAGKLSSKVKGTIEARNRFGRIIDSEKVSLKSNKVGARFGAGVGYKIDKNLSARLMVRYQKGNRFVKSVTSAGVGLMYSF